MTRKEAISILKNTAWIGTDKKVGEVEKAIMMAIEALKAQDVPDTNVGNNGDTIYRQDAIDAVKHAWAKGLEPTQYIEELPSTQFKRINKGIHEITESDKISYAVICDKFPSPHIYFNTYDDAEHWARFNQPNNRPFYIIERTEHFEIVGEVI